MVNSNYRSIYDIIEVKRKKDEEKSRGMLFLEI